MSDVLHVYLGSLKPLWVAYCERNGLSPGKVLKEAVERQLSQQEKAGGDAVAKQVEPMAGREEKKRRFELLLTESERRALDEHAKVEKCSKRQWVLDAIRVRLTQQPQFSTAEIQALGASNYQLRKIGQNLNQITKKVNSGECRTVDEALLIELKKQVDAHTKVVSASMRASIERWPLE